MPSKKKMVTITEISTSKTPLKVQSSGIVVSAKRKRKKGKNLTLSRTIGRNISMKDLYLRCLNDPFECAPVPVGFGTLVPTQVHTGYFRNYLTTNVDGTFDLTVLPNLAYMVIQNTSGNPNPPITTGSPAPYITYPASNLTSLKAICSSARVLAMGLRLFPNIALTNASGFIGLGLIPSMDDVEFGVVSAPATLPNSFVNAATYAKFSMPQLQIHKASNGNSGCLEVLWRPQDLSSFEFDADDIFGNPSSTSGMVQGPYLLAVGNSMPANTQIFYEVIIHLETTIGYKMTSSAVDDAASVYPSVKSDTSVYSTESLMTQIAPNLISSSHVLADAAVFSGKAIIAAQNAHALYTKVRGGLETGLGLNGGGWTAM